MYQNNTKAVMYNIITKEQAYALSVNDKTSISVIGLILNPHSTKIPQLMIIDEFKNFDNTRKKKFPGGKMERHDFNIEEAIEREIREETGLKVMEVEFCFAAEFSSTVANERHYKVFFLVTKYLDDGMPRKKDPGKLAWSDVVGIENKIIRNHHCCLKSAIKQMMTISLSYAQSLMNRYPEYRGVY